MEARKGFFWGDKRKWMKRWKQEEQRNINQQQKYQQQQKSSVCDVENCMGVRVFQYL